MEKQDSQSATAKADVADAAGSRERDRFHSYCFEVLKQSNNKRGPRNPPFEHREVLPLPLVAGCLCNLPSRAHWYWYYYNLFTIPHCRRDVPGRYAFCGSVPRYVEHYLPTVLIKDFT